MSRSNFVMPASIVAIMRLCSMSTLKVMPLIAIIETRQPDSRLICGAPKSVRQPLSLPYETKT